jgi:hypothetical protein
MEAPLVRNKSGGKRGALTKELGSPQDSQTSAN